MSVYATKAFWVEAGDRAIRTFVQAFLGSLGAGFIITDVSTLQVALIAAATAAFLSVLMSFLASNSGDTDAISLAHKDIPLGTTGLDIQRENAPEWGANKYPESQ